MKLLMWSFIIHNDPSFTTLSYFKKIFNYINGVSTFLFFYFGVLTLFLLNQVSKLSYFFYFGVSILFLFNQSV